MPRKPVARAVVVVLYDGTYSLLTDHEGVVVGYESVAKAVASFEDTYERKHHQSYEGSMSACIHSLFFQVSVIPIRGTTDLEPIVKRNEDGSVDIASMRTVAGSMTGLVLDPEKGKAAWERGEKPRLVRGVA
jgi:hypothetical protein